MFTTFSQRIHPRNILTVVLGLVLLFNAAPHALTAAPPANPPAKDVSVVNSAESKFIAAFPKKYGAIKKNVMPVETALGTIQANNFSATSQVTLLLISQSNYPASLFKKQTALQTVDGAANGAMKNINATVESKREYNQGGIAGRSVVFKTSQKGKQAYGRADFWVLPPRLYQVMAISENPAEINSADVQGFFRSFQILK